MTSINIKPADFSFPKQGGLAHFKLSSTSGQKQAFKLTCPDPLYKIQPEYGFLPANGTVNVEVVRGNGPAKTVEMILLFADVKADEKDPKSVHAQEPRYELAVPLKTA